MQCQRGKLSCLYKARKFFCQQRNYNLLAVRTKDSFSKRITEHTCLPVEAQRRLQRQKMRAEMQTSPPLTFYTLLLSATKPKNITPESHTTTVINPKHRGVESYNNASTRIPNEHCPKTATGFFQQTLHPSALLFRVAGGAFGFVSNHQMENVLEISPQLPPWPPPVASVVRYPPRESRRWWFRRLGR